MSPVSPIEKGLLALRNPQKAKVLQRFFKTGKGEYGEGDIFLGITVPEIRGVVRDEARDASLEDARALLRSEYHEVRFAGVLMIVAGYKASDKKGKEAWYKLYLSEIGRGINNWDLIDVSAPGVVGEHLQQGGITAAFDDLAANRDLWKRRVAIVATFAFIKAGDFVPTVRIATTLRQDSSDLIQKATGWMLREMGKRGGEDELCRFLDAYGHEIPRTMLRYAIEHFSGERRLCYLELTRRYR